MTLSRDDERAIDRVAGLMRPGRRVLWITGAGLSADSGLPTYRGIGGLYADGRGTDEGWPIESVLSGMMMEVRPDVTWKYIKRLEEAARGANFNEGHRIIAESEAHFDAWVLTQNVDGFHHRAGSRNVTDIHGDLRTLVCTRRRCGRREEVEDYAGPPDLPRCPDCGSVVRPDVVLFGEALATEKVKALRRELDRGFDLVFSIGTTSVFPYIAEPVYEARDAGTPVVEINPGRTDVSDEVDIKIAAGAVEALGALWARYLARVQPTA